MLNMSLKDCDLSTSLFGGEVVLGQVDRLGAVKCTTGDGVKLQVLLEAASLCTSVYNSLLLVVNLQEVEDGDHEHGCSERNSSNSDLGCVPSSPGGDSENNCTVKLVCKPNQIRSDHHQQLAVVTYI